MLIQYYSLAEPIIISALLDKVRIVASRAWRVVLDNDILRAMLECLLLDSCPTRMSNSLALENLSEIIQNKMGSHLQAVRLRV